jgi:hypothetical protein
VDSKVSFNNQGVDMSTNAELDQAIKSVDEKFIWTADPFSFFTDFWFVMKDIKGHFLGDCDDYTITTLWFLCNQNRWRFLWHVLILHQYRIHRVRARTGDYHVVGQVGDLWFDNWARQALPRDQFFAVTGHQYLMWYPSVLTAWFMLWGWILEKFLRRSG